MTDLTPIVEAIKELVRATEEAAQPTWLTVLQMSMPPVAILVAVVALWYARRQQQLAIRPVLDAVYERMNHIDRIDTTKGPALGVWLDNVGVGPAHITGMRAYVDDKLVVDSTATPKAVFEWSAIGEALREDLLRERGELAESAVSDGVLRSSAVDFDHTHLQVGRSIHLWGFLESDVDSISVLQRKAVELFMRRVKIVVTHEDLLGKKRHTDVSPPAPSDNFR